MGSVVGRSLSSPLTLTRKERYGDEADDRWLRTFCENLSRIQREKRGFVLQIQQGMAREKSDMQNADHGGGNGDKLAHPAQGHVCLSDPSPGGGKTGSGSGEGQKQWEEAIKDEVEMVSEWFEPIEDDRGRGTLRFGNGEVFVGEFQNGQQHGKGTYTYKSGNVEVGFYDQGKDKGRAVRLSADRR